MTDNGRQSSGRDAEARALAFLNAQGLRLLASNWSCRLGEIDLIMLDGDTLVFVEVRYRKHSAWGGALESVDTRKRQKLIRTAQLFLQKEKRWSNHPCRFDVIAMGSQQETNWLRNAFDC